MSARAESLTLEEAVARGFVGDTPCCKQAAIEVIRVCASQAFMSECTASRWGRVAEGVQRLEGDQLGIGGDSPPACARCTRKVEHFSAILPQARTRIH
jgi:hypothetical protein